MSSSPSIAATLRPEARQKIAIEALSKPKPITHLAKEYQVSRKFVRIQRQQAKVASVISDKFLAMKAIEKKKLPPS